MIFYTKKVQIPVFYIKENSTAFVLSKNNTYDTVNMKEYYQEYCSKTIWYFLMKYLSYTEKCANDKNHDTEFRDTWNNLNFLINIFSHFKPWDDKLEDTDPNNFYYEREWRALNNINFVLSDVKIICIPKIFRERLTQDFPDYDGTIKEIL